MFSLFNKSLFVVYALFFVIGGLLYANTLSNPFVFDDYDFIVNNPNIWHITDIKSIWNSLGHPSRFIVFLSFAINFFLGQFNVVGYHCVNILIHICNAIFVYHIVLLLFRTKTLKAEQELALRIAFVAGLLFLVHPLQTQAVTYITQRFTSMATLFYLISVWAYLVHRLNNKGVRYFVITVCAAVLGMLTKQIVFTLPIMLFVIEKLFFKNDKDDSPLKQHFLLLGSLLLIIPLCMKFNVKSIFFSSFMSGSHDGDVITMGRYFLTQCRVVWIYIKLFFIPTGQSLDHDVALSMSVWHIRVLLGGLSLGSLFILAIKYCRRQTMLAFTALWFFITITVTSSIIPIHHVIFEHRMYLPSVGLSILVAYAMTRVIKNKELYIALFVLVSFILGLTTINRNTIWQSEERLWADVVKKAPNKARGYESLATLAYKQGDYIKALKLYNKAIELYPHAIDAYVHRGRVYYMLKKYNQALDNLNHVLDRRKTHALALKDRGDVWVKLKKYDKAFKDYDGALTLNPLDADALSARASLLGRENKFTLALKDLNKAITINPYKHEFYNNRGIVFAMNDKHSQALTDFNKALTLRSDLSEIYINMAASYRAIDDLTQALRWINHALVLDNNNMLAYWHRSLVYEGLGFFEDAAKDAVIIFHNSGSLMKEWYKQETITHIEKMIK
ncbi:MAG: tetratricopeptide (TPR) repeat protein [Lysobacterales bacterium]|jgi:tetratricopeptide (TPR) repeat protein